MKLRNKKTGGILELAIHHIGGKSYGSLAEIEQDWEDVPEEAKGWYVTMYGDIIRITKNDEILITDLKEIGNYFDTREEAEKAVEKLKAWKRLKDKGFRFIEWTESSTDEIAAQVIRCDFGNAGYDDLCLLFGGEE